MRRLEVSGLRRIILVGAVLAIGVGGAKLQAQTQLADPKDAPKIFASTCSACHKSPQGLAKSGQVAGFLRQHYTTGPEMSAAMAAYLVAAGSGPASKKGDKSAENPKTKGKKQDQVAAAPGTDPAADAKDRTLRGKQRNGKQHEPKQHEAKQQQDDPPARPSPLPAVTPVAPDSIRQAAAPVTTGTTGASDAPGTSAQEPAQQPAQQQPGLEVPMPPLPDPV